MKKKKGITGALDRSPIDYFSDLFIVSMVLMWLVSNIYQSIIATIVTMSSISLSLQMGYDCINTSMWSDIGNNVAVPLTAGGALWMVKCAAQHYIANKNGKTVKADFPKVDVEDIELEEPVNLDAVTPEMPEDGKEESEEYG